MEAGVDQCPPGWEAALETGIPAVDRQHRSLYQQILSLRDRTNSDRLNETLLFLQGYVVDHFATEERMHEESEYPNADEHLATHARFIQEFLAMKSEYEADQQENRLITLMKLIKWLINWLRGHIMGMDTEFARYWHARNSKVHSPLADPDL